MAVINTDNDTVLKTSYLAEFLTNLTAEYTVELEICSRFTGTHSHQSCENRTKFSG